MPDWPPVLWVLGLLTPLIWVIFAISWARTNRWVKELQRKQSEQILAAVRERILEEKGRE